MCIRDNTNDILIVFVAPLLFIDKLPLMTVDSVPNVACTFDNIMLMLIIAPVDVLAVPLNDTTPEIVGDEENSLYKLNVTVPDKAPVV